MSFDSGALQSFVVLFDDNSALASSAHLLFFIKLHLLAGCSKNTFRNLFVVHTTKF